MISNRAIVTIMLANLMLLISMTLAHAQTSADCAAFTPYVVVQGQAAFDQQDYDTALDAYNCALQQDPDDPQAYYGQGQVYSAQGDYIRAINDFSTAIRLNYSPLGMAYYQRSTAYFYQTNYESARADVNMTVQLMPDYVYSYLTLGSIEVNQGHYAKALVDFQHAAHLDSSLADPYYDQAITYAWLGDSAQIGFQLGEAAGRRAQIPNDVWGPGAAENIDAIGERTFCIGRKHQVFSAGDHSRRVWVVTGRKPQCRVFVRLQIYNGNRMAWLAPQSYNKKHDHQIQRPLRT